MEEGRQQNAGYLSASAAAERLQRNVQREHSLCTDFLLAFWQVPPQPGWRHDLDQSTKAGCVKHGSLYWHGPEASRLLDSDAVILY